MQQVRLRTYSAGRMVAKQVGRLPVTGSSLCSRGLSHRLPSVLARRKPTYMQRNTPFRTVLGTAVLALIAFISVCMLDSRARSGNTVEASNTERFEPGSLITLPVASKANERAPSASQCPPDWRLVPAPRER